MLTLATFGRKYLNETVGTRSGQHIRVIERPGRWMNDHDLAHLVSDLQAVVKASIPAGNLDYGPASGSKERLENCIMTIVYDADAKPVAFNALAILQCELRGRQVEVLHLGLSVISPAVRERGLSGVLYGMSCFLISARRQLRPLWISNVTQVPAVFGMVAGNFHDVYPGGPKGKRQRYDHLHLARQIMAKYRHVFGVGDDATFDEAKSIIRNSYTGGSDNLKKSFEESPKHRVGAYNDFCRQELDYERGDDFLQIGKFTAPVAAAYLTRSASVVSPTKLAMQFGARALVALVGPTLQWLDAGTQLGDIRPAAPILSRRSA